MKRDSSLLLHSTRAAQSQDPPPGDTLLHQAIPRSDDIFYRGLTYGSEAYIGPLDVILNKGLALSRTRNARQDVFNVDYGWQHVWSSLGDPVAAIERGGGWGKFFREEVFPLTFNVTGDRSQGKWYPNYFGHLLEGGIVYRRLGEWYRARGVPLPFLLSGITNFGAAILNEAYENQGSTRGSAGTVADLYIFDIGGMLLFSNERVARFFAEKLRATVWPYQASLTLPDGLVINSGNHITMKIPLSPIPKTSIFFQAGINTHLGLTVHLPENLDLSFGAGPATKDRMVDPETGEESVTFQFSGIVTVDRNNSLLASLTWTEMDSWLMGLNVYPGVIGLPICDFGFWAILTRDYRLQFGITHHRLLGLGLGFAK